MTTYLHPRYWAVALLSLASFALLSVLGYTAGASDEAGGLIFGVSMLAFGLVGALIIARDQGNRIGWVFAVIGIFAPFSSFQQLALGLLESGVNADIVAIGQIIASAAWNVFFLCLLVLIPLWYPSGSAINRYFGLAAPIATLGWVMLLFREMGRPAVKILVDLDLPPPNDWTAIANPLEPWPIPDSAFFDLGGILLLLSIPVAVTSMVIRRVRSRGVERLQMKWLLFSEGLFVAFAILTLPLETQIDALSQGGQLLLGLTQGALALGVPISVGIAITKHRLYDIDVVTSKTVTYGALAVFITGVYALVVVGIGSLIGTGSEPNLMLSIAAVAIVAVAFEPARSRLQRWANRLVFGHRATPYEVLSGATARLAESGSRDEALEQVTQLVVDGTGATEAVLWLKVGGNLQPSAATPPAALAGLNSIRMTSEVLPALPGDMSTTVRHRGDMLGALSFTKARGESVTGTDEKMLHDVASGIGLFLRNIGLNAELTERAEQLRTSRRRLVAAHDEERHRLERDLHDGAQQQIVAIKVKLGIARTLAEREGAPEVETLVLSLADATQEAVEEMRAVAHGIYPPLLEAEGLSVALAAASRTISLPIELEMGTLDRYERAVEEGTYFCILETLTHAIDGGATWANVNLSESAGTVRFAVRHNGDVSELVAVEDRIAAFDGSVTITPDPTAITIAGTLPSAELVAVKS